MLLAPQTGSEHAGCLLRGQRACCVVTECAVPGRMIGTARDRAVPDPELPHHPVLSTGAHTLGLARRVCGPSRSTRMADATRCSGPHDQRSHDSVKATDAISRPERHQAGTRKSSTPPLLGTIPCRKSPQTRPRRYAACNPCDLQRARTEPSRVYQLSGDASRWLELTAGGP